MIDFSEPIPAMIERLIQEHGEIAPRLDQIGKATDESLDKAIKLLGDIGVVILRHAVEEEARIMRVIMKNAKSESEESVRIMQEHRWVSEFLERRLNDLHEIPPAQAQAEIHKFLSDLRKHFQEEENMVFPLALEVFEPKE
jgi:hemerythrin-like domain-containing protein